MMEILDWVGHDIDDEERLYRLQQVYDAMLRIVWLGAVKKRNVGGQTYNIFRFKMMKQLRDEIELLEQKVNEDSSDTKEFVIRYEHTLPRGN